MEGGGGVNTPTPETNSVDDQGEENTPATEEDPDDDQGTPVPKARTTILSLTGSSSALETAQDQADRRYGDDGTDGIVGQTDSYLATTFHGDTTKTELPTFTVQPSCTELTCRAAIPSLVTVPVQLRASVDPAGRQAILSKNGITLVEAKPNANLNAYGSWMNHAFFGVQSSRFTYQGTTVTLRFGLAGGDLTGSRPSGAVSWRGLMVGMPATGSDKGNRLQGNAYLAYYLGPKSLSATFYGIKDIDRLASHSTSYISFSSVPVTTGGTFSTGSVGDRIEGGFYGSGHAEAAGTFERSGIIGTFGAKRQQ